MSAANQNITSLLLKYQSALNTASVPLATSLYHPTDSICMPPNAPVGSFAGPEGITKAYEFFFSMIKFDVKFEIHEIVYVTPDLLDPPIVARSKRRKGTEKAIR